MTPLKINKPLHLYIVRWSGSSLHAARYAERGGDGRQDADGYLNHHFPGFLFHHLFLCYGFYDLMNAVDGGEFQPCGGWNSIG